MWGHFVIEAICASIYHQHSIREICTPTFTPWSICVPPLHLGDLCIIFISGGFLQHVYTWLCINFYIWSDLRNISTQINHYDDWSASFIWRSCFLCHREPPSITILFLPQKTHRLPPHISLVYHGNSSRQCVSSELTSSFWLRRLLSTLWQRLPSIVASQTATIPSSSEVGGKTQWFTPGQRRALLYRAEMWLIIKVGIWPLALGNSLRPPERRKKIQK